jgi:peptidyl-prolyl cis-trans isomerase C
MKLRVLLLSAALASGFLHMQAVHSAEAKPPAGKPVSVNGKPISQAKMEAVVKQRVAQGQPDNEQLRRGILEILVNQELLSQEAERLGLLKSGDNAVQLDLARQNALANMTIEDHIRKSPIKEEAARAEYEKLKSQRGEREYRARHILVDSEAVAKDIVSRLQKGEKFEELAKLSKDPGSRERGGDLDWAAPTNFVKPFSDAMIKLDKGKFTDTPVQTQFGFHVIRLDDMRSTPFPPYEQVKQQVINGMHQAEVQNYLRELRSKAKIE